MTDPIPHWSARAFPGPIEPDSRRFADYMPFRHEAPLAAVRAVVAVVADHEIHAGRHIFLRSALIGEHAGQVLPIAAHEAAHVLAVAVGQARRPHYEIGACEHLVHVAAEMLLYELHVHIAAVAVAALDLERNGLAVDIEPVVAHFDVVSGQADQPFDVVDRWIARIAEYDYIATCRLADIDHFTV